MRFKDSGIEWLGEIPEHWEIKPLKAIFNQRNEQNSDLKINNILSLVKDIGVIPYEEKGNLGNKSKDKLQEYKIAKINDLVINKMNAVIGSLGLSKYEGLVSPVYLVLYIDNPNYFINYYSYIFQAQEVQHFLKTFSYGIMEIREAIDYLEFKKMSLPLPPLEEQKAIAEFLDKKCDKISQFIESKQKLITLLQEKKQALINECVTKGVNCYTKYNAESRSLRGAEALKQGGSSATATLELEADKARLSPISEKAAAFLRSGERGGGEALFAQKEKDSRQYKESGVKYLGTIPKHWEVRKLKYIVFSRNQRKDDKDFKIGLENIESKTGKYIPTNENMFEDSGISFYKNDILFGKLRPYLAKVFLADRDGICVSEFLVLESKEAYSNFLKFLMLSSSFIDIIDSSTYGTKMPRTSWEFVGNLKIPLPPLQEQKAIADYLDTQITKIDLAIEKTKQQIALIKEYKTSLINQAICGRIQQKD